LEHSVLVLIDSTEGSLY